MDASRAQRVTHSYRRRSALSSLNNSRIPAVSVADGPLRHQPLCFLLRTLLRRRLGFAERLLLILAELDLVRRSAEYEVRKQNYNRQSDNQHDVEAEIKPRSSAV